MEIDITNLKIPNIIEVAFDKDCTMDNGFGGVKIVQGAEAVHEFIQSWAGSR